MAMARRMHTRRQYVKMILSVILHNLFKVCLYTISEL